MTMSRSRLVVALAFAMILFGLPEVRGPGHLGLPAVPAAEAWSTGGLVVFTNTPGVPVSFGGFSWDSGRGVWVQDYWSGWLQPLGQGGYYLYRQKYFCNVWKTGVGWWWSYADQRTYTLAWANSNCIDASADQ